MSSHVSERDLCNRNLHSPEEGMIIPCEKPSLKTRHLQGYDKAFSFSFKFFYLFLKIIMKYSCLIRLCQFLQQSDSVVHTHVFFFTFFSAIVYRRMFTIVPVLYGMTLLFVQSAQFASANSKLPIHTSLTTLSLDNHKSLLCFCEFGFYFINKFHSQFS